MTIDGITFNIYSARKQAEITEPPAHCWQRIDGSPWMQRYDYRPATLLRLPELADFCIDPYGTLVEAWPAPGLDHEVCHQLYLSNVMPMALSRQGKLVLHASAVEVDSSALVFVGVSGRGKSTLATSFAGDGHALVVDDGLVVESHGGRFMAMPGNPSVRLWRDSEQLLSGSDAHADPLLEYTEKRRIDSSDALRFCPRPLPIRAIFLLGDDPDANLGIKPLPPSLALIELVHYSFLLDVGNAERHAALMRTAASLASSCRVALLDYTRDYAQLPQVRQAILESVSSTPKNTSVQLCSPAP